MDVLDLVLSRNPRLEISGLLLNPLMNRDRNTQPDTWNNNNNLKWLGNTLSFSLTMRHKQILIAPLRLPEFHRTVNYLLVNPYPWFSRNGLLTINDKYLMNNINK